MANYEKNSKNIENCCREGIQNKLSKLADIETYFL